MKWTDLNFLKVSERAAIKASFFRGILDKYGADKSATDEMRTQLNNFPISATVIIGEGEMDDAPMLFIGEKLGTGGEKVDVAVDPLEGTTLTSKNQSNAITVLALSEEGSFLNAPDMYMKKLAVGKQAFGKLDISLSLTENLTRYQKITQKSPVNIVVAMLDRERHQGYMQEVLDFGARLFLISDGDILPAILTGFPEFNIDLLYGTGGAPEGVISAAALKCLGGDFQGILVPENTEQLERCRAMGMIDPEKHLFTRDELVKKKDIIVSLTAVTDSFFGRGVYERDSFYVTESLLIRNDKMIIQKTQSFYPKENF